MAASGQTLRTLLIDDSQDLRELLTVALGESGRFEVVGDAGDGAAGVAMARRLHPDLVLLDVAMPGRGGGGLDVLPNLREAAPESTVVVMSGYPREDLETRAVGRGAAGYIEKGMSLRGFVDRVVAAAGVLELVTSSLDEQRSEFDRDLRSSSHARRFVSAALERWDCEDALDTVQLLVTELVTNAVVHAGAKPSVAVILLPHALRVEVGDSDPSGPVAREASDEAESGRGLLLLDQMATRWGVETAADGKTVWFEVARFDEPQP